MPKKIITIGFSLAIDDVESTTFDAKTSLLDWDIVLFRPDIDHIVAYEYGASDYLGKPCLNDKRSFQLREACAHWRREILQAVEAGKLVVVFLNSPKQVYVATGSVSTSGTGRNQKVTRHVDLCSNYESLPVRAGWTATVGTSMTLHPSARELLAPYWQKFGKSSQYNVVWNDDAKGVCLQTQHGQKPVGLSLTSKVSTGALLLLPDLDFDRLDFFGEDQDGEEIWTEAAEQFAASLIAELVALSKAIATDGEKTPEPEWASGAEYALAPEIELRQQLLIAEAELEKAQKAKDEVAARLEDSGQLRSLLFEKGPPLEAAIISALNILGFQAEPYHDGVSEFDAIFESAEGRLLGEAEGKDNKAINIEKLRQLSTNIHEDLQREQVQQPAKGVLFGNGFRLTKPEERQQQFTEKCISSASSMSFSLVSTDRLYAVVQYLLNNPDEDYARRCRLAIVENKGLIAFPDLPGIWDSSATEMLEVSVTAK